MLEHLHSGNTQEHNLLVVSDLHIGQDMSGLTRFAALRRIARLNRELCAFFGYYSRTRAEGRPWRLVLAGDIIDFMQVSLRPDGPEARTRWHSFRLTPDEEVYGLGHGPERAVWKLERVMDRHQRVFLALARFVAAGNEVCIIRGNHDHDLHWEEVQVAFRALLAELYASAQPGEPVPDFASRVRFYPWFYYQEGVAYIEHGHQYDEYSSFEYFLDPHQGHEGERRDFPVPLLALRYFANLFPGFPVLVQDQWTIMDYFRWAFRPGSNPLRVLYLYLRLLVLIFFVHGRGRAKAPRERNWLERRLADLERLYGLPREILRRIYEMHVKPAGHSLWRSIQVLFVDRILVALGVVAAVVGVALAPLPGWVQGILIAAVPLLGGLALWWLARIRDVTCDRQLALAARRLAETLKVKFVVMGHSHTPLAQSHGLSWYLNTGTWIPPPGRARHSGGCDCDLTHLAVLQGDAGLRARLLRWCSAAKRPEPMEEVG
jgi:UDP-2,3-diacylglucosamine pyrophosphatase LpxH